MAQRSGNDALERWKGKSVRQDYKPGGIISAAPGDAGRFHGHFGSSKEPLRLLAFLGGYPRRVNGIPGRTGGA